MKHRSAQCAQPAGLSEERKRSLCGHGDSVRRFDALAIRELRLFRRRIARGVLA
ncbi:hypothetical protein KCP77_09060 [Salmonella enterica subsp. enterica]|nr:hypothetical protein KCP77_09060 [Salmonella enterica subsp. enterica]